MLAHLHSSYTSKRGRTIYVYKIKPRKTLDKIFRAVFGDWHREDPDGSILLFSAFFIPYPCRIQYVYRIVYILGSRIKIPQNVGSTIILDPPDDYDEEVTKKEYGLS